MATLFEAYVTNAGKYSEGQLVGEILKFPTTAQEVEALLKREMYYGKKFESREELEKAITEYIDYYTNDRPQRGLGVLTPMEFHEKQRLAA